MTIESNGIDRGKLPYGHGQFPRAVDSQRHEGLHDAVVRLADYIRANPHAALTARALTCMVLGDYRGTVEESDKLDEFTLDDAIGYFARGCVHTKLGQLHQAVEDFGTSIALDPDNMEFRRSRALAYHRLGELDKVVDDYGEAISLQPDNPFLHYSRGKVFLDLGEHRAAIENFNRAIELDPDCDEAYYQRGVARAELSEYRQAIEDFDQFIRLNPNDPFVRYDRQLAVEEAEAQGV